MFHLKAAIIFTRKKLAKKMAAAGFEEETNIKGSEAELDFWLSFIL